MRATGLVLTLALACAGSACGGKMPTTRYYHLSPPTGRTAGGEAVLVLEALATDAAYDDERIVYRTNPYRFDYYDYHRWSAAPGVMISNYLEVALERSGRFRSVVREASPQASAVLTGRVAAIEEVDEAKGRWLGRVVVELRLTDVISGDNLWTEQYEEVEPLTVQTPEGLARALSVAMGRIAAQAGPAIADTLASRPAAPAADAVAAPAR